MTNKDDLITDPNPNVSDSNCGLTKREYFASKAMQALISNPSVNRPRQENLEEDLISFSKIAVEYADGLIKVLNK